MITGATKVAQIEETVAAADVVLDDDAIARIEAALL